jgi:hypothetical protein
MKSPIGTAQHPLTVNGYRFLRICGPLIQNERAPIHQTVFVTHESLLVSAITHKKREVLDAPPQLGGGRVICRCGPMRFCLGRRAGRYCRAIAYRHCRQNQICCLCCLDFYLSSYLSSSSWVIVLSQSTGGLRSHIIMALLGDNEHAARGFHSASNFKSALENSEDWKGLRKNHV